MNRTTMNRTNFDQRRQIESLDRAALTTYQLDRLNAVLDETLPANAFYVAKLASIGRPIRSLAELADWPFTFKQELASGADDHNFARNRTWPIERYTRLHQTSGTHGRPIVVLDTAEDWQWWMECWHYVLDAAEITAADRALMAFSFGPFVGFWSAYDALAERGCLLIPSGGVNSLGRLEMARHAGATVVCCTPSYALHLAEVAAEHKINLASLEVRRIILAGEPGGSVPAVRAKIESAWQAIVLDHCGASEVGPWGYGDLLGEAVWINEACFLPEFISVATGQPAEEGELSELVLTTLGRVGSPVFRYRTGDLVRPSWRPSGDRHFVRLLGGILGRADDMLVVRGVNIFPSSIEQIIRSFPEIVEFRVSVYKEAELDRLVVEIEDHLEEPERVAAELQIRLGLSVAVELAPQGSLPRYEAKAHRFIDRRG